MIRWSYRRIVPSRSGVATLLLIGSLVCALVAPPAPAATTVDYADDFFTVTTSSAKGGTAIIDIILDIDRDGVVDTGEPIWQHFEVVDGGPRPPQGAAVVADTDGLENSSIRIQFRFAGPPMPFIGKYVLRAVKGSTTDRITLTFNPLQGDQSVSGQVLLNGTTPAPAVVFILDAQGREVEFVLTDSQGRYTLPLVAPGQYGFHALALNLGSTRSVVRATVAPGQDLTGVNLTIPQLPHRWQGQLRRSDNAAPVPYMHISAELEDVDGVESLGITDANGYFDLPIESGCWEVYCSEDYAQQRGYVGLTPPAGDCGLLVEGGNVTGVAYALVPIAGFVTGRAENVLTHADLSGAGIDVVTPGDGDWIVEGLTGSNGRFTLGVPVGSWEIRAGLWDESPLHGTLLMPDQSYPFTIAGGDTQDIGTIGFLPSDGAVSVQVLQYPNTPLPGVSVGTWGHDDTTQADYRASEFITGADGRADIPTRSGGTWYIHVEQDSIPAGLDGIPEHRTDILAQMGNRLIAYPAGFRFRPYRVYGGTSLPPGGTDALYPSDLGYTYLGEASGTARFNGTYPYYCLVAYEGRVSVDSVRDNGGGDMLIAQTANVENWNNAAGAPDGVSAILGPAQPYPQGGALYLQPQSALTGIVIVHPAPMADQIVEGLVGRTPAWNSLDVNEDGVVDIADVVFSIP